MQSLCGKPLFPAFFRQHTGPLHTGQKRASNRSEVSSSPVTRQPANRKKAFPDDRKPALTSVCTSFDCQHFTTFLSDSCLPRLQSFKIVHPCTRRQTSQPRRLCTAKCQNVNRDPQKLKINFFRTLNIFNHVFKYEYENIFLILHRVSEKRNATKNEKLHQELSLNIINP